MRRHRQPSEAPSKEAEDYAGERWEYRARNLGKVAGVSLERDFNEHGAAGWEFVAVAKDYAIFKRPAAEADDGESGASLGPA